MKGDFDRLTFDQEKHYRLVMRQQGRVDVAADWNEQQQILRHFGETEAADVIGPAGVPQAGADGFKVGVNAAGDLTLGRGRIYVQGILCENDADGVTLSKQPDLPPPPAGAASTPPVNGSNVAYLDVWLRHLTALDDGHIRETALGGPDTATRAKVVWQVKVQPGTTCEGFTPPPDPTGTLAARTGPVDPGDDPCVLPPTAGYRRLQNQLYRIEVHQGGTPATATFKWSRDNGSVVTKIVTGNTPGGSAVLTVHDIGPDDNLGFRAGQSVEVVDDRAELNALPGRLYRIAKPPADNTTIELDLAGGPAPDVVNMLNPKLRRWDQVSTAGGPDLANGVPMAPVTADGWVPLEDNLQVRFSTDPAATYRTGDYWQVPARTAIDDSTGNIEWPKDSAGPGGQAALPPQGIEHSYCPLAVVASDGKLFLPNPAPTDCRKLFPPLTALPADDCCCPVSIPPGPGWPAALQRALENARKNARGDLHVCLKVGTYPLAAALELTGPGNLVITGGGPGTRILAPRSECALKFTNFDSVTVSGLHAEAGLTGNQSPDRKGLRGVLWFVACKAVTVEAATLRCGFGAKKAATCVTVQNPPPPGAPRPVNLLAPATKGAPRASPTSARIRHCDLSVGLRQVGVLVVNVDRTRIEDNLISVDRGATEKLPLRDLLQRFQIRSNFTKFLVSAAQVSPVSTGIQPGPLLRAAPEPAPSAEPIAPAAPPAPAEAAPSAEPAAPTPSAHRASVSDGTTRVQFRTPPALAQSWQPLLDADLRARPGPVPLLRRLQSIASRILTSADFRRTAQVEPWFRGLAQAFQGSSLYASQGIVIAGQTAGDVRVRDNTIIGFSQGIHVGVSHKAAAGEPKRRQLRKGAPLDEHDRASGADPGPDSAGTVHITGNAIGVWLAPAVRGREGIFVGNVEDLLVEGNRLELFRQSAVFDRLLFARIDRITVAGIRIFGLLGPMMVVRQNLVQGFNPAVLVHPLLAQNSAAPDPKNALISSQWLVAENRTDASHCRAEGQWAPQVRLSNNSPPP